MPDSPDKRTRLNKVREVTRKSAACQKGNEARADSFLLDRVEEYCILKNKYMLVQHEGEIRRFYFYPDKTVAIFCVKKTEKGKKKTGRPATNWVFEGALVLMDDEVLLSKQEFICYLEALQKEYENAFECYFALKAQFLKKETLLATAEEK